MHRSQATTMNGVILTTFRLRYANISFEFNLRFNCSSYSRLASKVISKLSTLLMGQSSLALLAHS